jgi:hypothetical protein
MTTAALPRVAPETVVANEIMAAYKPLGVATVLGQRTGVIDPKITEVTRLRVARYHDCQICGSVRVLEAELDESLATKIDRFESSDLPEKWKVALRLTDAMITTPGQMTLELRDDIRHHFSDEQVSQMIYDILKWSCNKALVSMRVDTPPGVAEAGYDDDGNQLFGVEAKVQWDSMQAARH